MGEQNRFAVGFHVLVKQARVQVQGGGAAAPPLLQAAPRHVIPVSRAAHASRVRAAAAADALDQVRHVCRHLLNGRVVEHLKLLQRAQVLNRHKVDGHTLAAEAPAASDAVDVVLAVGGKIVVDDERHLHAKCYTYS